MEKVKLLDKGVIELPKKVLEKFQLEKGMEFDVFVDSDSFIGKPPPLAVVLDMKRH